jgi:hypothetical protein
MFVGGASAIPGGGEAVVTKQGSAETHRLTIDLPEGVATRLELAAARQQRAASDVVAELLDRHLPHLEARETKKGGKIPYA